MNARVRARKKVRYPGSPVFMSSQSDVEKSRRKTSVVEMKAAKQPISRAKATMTQFRMTVFMKTVRATRK